MSEWRAYEGPNGWYVALEDDAGYHHQPQDGGNMSERAAKRAAKRAVQDDEDSVD